MNYSQETQALIERQCKNVERLDFKLDKKNAEECLLKTYDLFGLSRPKNIIWLKDVFDKKFQDVARWSAWSAWSARSAWSAESAWSARLAWSAESALDYNFDWYVFEFEYCKNPEKDKLPDENDFKYLEYCELLMQAKEYGLGYRVEFENTLYLVPTPLVLIDEQNRFHSDTKPAIRWKGGKEIYYLYGVNFDKKLWTKIVNNKLSAVEILKLENIEQRYIALKYLGAERLLTELNAELIEQSERGNKLYKIDNIITDKSLRLLKYVCPSTGREYVSFVPYEQNKADEAMAWKHHLTIEEYNQLKIEA